MELSLRARHEADLAAFYTSELHERVHRELPAQRVARRDTYLELLEREGRRSVLEIGSGPGRDGVAFAAAGRVYTGWISRPRASPPAVHRVSPHASPLS